jgi:hypothetical protein
MEFLNFENDEIYYNSFEGDSQELANSESVRFEPPGKNASKRVIEYRDTFVLMDDVSTNVNSSLYVPCLYSVESVLEPLRFPPPFTREEGEVDADIFKGKLYGCPDSIGMRSSLDMKGANTKNFAEVAEKIQYPGTIVSMGVKSLVLNLYYRASDLFQEFIWDIARGYENLLVVAFTNVGAYIREKSKRYEAWCSFVELPQSVDGGQYGSAYDIDAARPTAIENWLFPEEADALSEEKRAEKAVLPKVYWSAERMRPFLVDYSPKLSRIALNSFLAGNGVGFKKGMVLPPKSSTKYLLVMAEFEARQVMRGLQPNYPISIVQMAARLREGVPKGKIHLVNERKSAPAVPSPSHQSDSDDDVEGAGMLGRKRPTKVRERERDERKRRKSREREEEDESEEDEPSILRNIKNEKGKGRSGTKEGTSKTSSMVVERYVDKRKAEVEEEKVRKG